MQTSKANMTVRADGPEDDATVVANIAAVA